jgi:hypothetical protein
MIGSLFFRDITFLLGFYVSLVAKRKASMPNTLLKAFWHLITNLITLSSDKIHTVSFLAVLDTMFGAFSVGGGTRTLSHRGQIL